MTKRSPNDAGRKRCFVGSGRSELHSATCGTPRIEIDAAHRLAHLRGKTAACFFFFCGGVVEGRALGMWRRLSFLAMTMACPALGRMEEGRGTWPHAGSALEEFATQP